MKEVKLASYVIEYLESKNWEVFQEVQFRSYGKIADIVAVRDNKLWIIESKTTLTFKVLDQAKWWKCHYRSIAVPSVRDWRSRILPYDICRNYLKIGILEVGEKIYTKDAVVKEKIPAEFMREFHQNSEHLMRQLSDGHKTHAKAGSSNGGHFTPYRQTMEQVKEFIENNPGCTLSEIINCVGKGHYSSISSARGAIRNALENFEDWCDVKKRNKEYKYFMK